jgi:hypothetical protein
MRGRPISNLLRERDALFAVQARHLEWLFRGLKDVAGGKTARLLEDGTITHLGLR